MNKLMMFPMLIMLSIMVMGFTYNMYEPSDVSAVNLEGYYIDDPQALSEESYLGYYYSEGNDDEQFWVYDGTHPDANGYDYICFADIDDNGWRDIYCRYDSLVEVKSYIESERGHIYDWYPYIMEYEMNYYYKDNMTGTLYYLDYNDNGYDVFYSDGSVDWHSDWLSYGRFDTLNEFEAKVYNDLNDVDIFNPNILYSALLIAIGVSILGGVYVFGTGVSEFSQKIMFTSAIYGVIWTALTIGAIPLITGDVLGIFGPIIYSVFTIMYVIGFASTVIGQTSEFHGR